MNKISFVSFSNFLIFLSIIFTLASHYYSGILIFGLNSYFVDQGKIGYYFIQAFTSQFFHGSFSHILFNSIFIFYYGNILEAKIGIKKYMIFFILFCLFNAIIFYFFMTGNTIGISGFAMAILSYITLLLYFQKNPEYKGGITAILLNIFIGFAPGISFLGHVSGAIFGVLYFFMLENKKKLI